MTPQAAAELLELVDRVRAYLTDAPMGGRHSDIAGANAYELLNECTDELSRLAAPAQDREAIARIVDPMAWEVFDSSPDEYAVVVEQSLQQADAIIALNVGGRAATNEIQSSDGRDTSSLPSGESELSVTTASGPSEALPQSGDVRAALIGKATWALCDAADGAGPDACEKGGCPSCKNDATTCVDAVLAALSLPAQKEADGIRPAIQKIVDYYNGFSDNACFTGKHVANILEHALGTIATPDTAPDGVREYQVPMVGTNELNDTVRTYCKTCGKLLSEERDG